MRESEEVRKDIYESSADISRANPSDRGLKRAEVGLLAIIAEMLLDLRDKGSHE